ncbi:MAG: maltose alpha-D-glucosyltransferase [Elusimicrobia bacterium RIFOXYB2_FULL_48_7]|nr:MAG: maltose alpha-D-glucosyltransferase [Elusimicrobia bacterium RIFOXYB2_FULL_48_7]
MPAGTKCFYFENDPLWYKNAVIYELHVRSFYDSNNDGIGDFRGLTSKLDYLNSLGINTIWLLPFYPSPLKDDGYDIADYFNIHPNYGTLSDFRNFLCEAHLRGIRVITELVLNHTSDQHSWFKKARSAPKGSIARDFYVWSDSQEKYKDARIIFKDFETSNWAWDTVANSYYWHRFYTHQPDLNYNSPQVQRAILKVIDYWFDMGVDGLRLDAIPYLFEKEGTNCENLPETYEYLKTLRRHIDSKYTGRVLLAEANQWPEDAAAYFGNGDSCQMAFHFPLMPRMFMSMWMEDRFPVIDIFEQTPAIPDNCQWALFLRNHDELTLEMVTDEERDYMYRVYAKDPATRINIGIRRRLAPLLGKHRRKYELMNILLFSLPGTPVIYYGDEIGMGDNFHLGDRNGVRTPMQWSSDKNAGFSRANPQKLYLPIIIDPEYHYETVNVENNESNQSSILWWMKRVVAMRKRYKAFGSGNLEFLPSNNPRVLAFTRAYKDEIILIVINLSRFSQAVELDLSKYAGYFPEEIFSRNRFPAVKETPYAFTLGFYDYFWFELKKEDIGLIEGSKNIFNINIEGEIKGKAKEQLEREVLPDYLVKCRWFKSKSQKILQVKIIENIKMYDSEPLIQILLLETTFVEGLSEVYILPVCPATGPNAEKIKIDAPYSVIANLKINGEDGIIYDGIYNEEFRKTLLLMIEKRHSIEAINGRLTGHPGRHLKKLLLSGKSRINEKSTVSGAQSSNTSILYGNELFFKLYRRVEEGVNPEIEIGRFLTEKTDFKNAPPYAGMIEYTKRNSRPTAVGILQGAVNNPVDAWQYTLDSLARYFERVLAKLPEVKKPPAVPESFLDAACREIPPLMQETIGVDYIEMIKLLGTRTAQLHLALASDIENPDFAPEPFTLLYQRSRYQSMQGLTKKVFDTFKKSQKSAFNAPDALKEKAAKFLVFEKEIINRFSLIYKEKTTAMKIRIHGDYHLGQLLFTGNDFASIDFEGEPMRTLNERRLKKSALKDIAGMIRSLHYAAYTSLMKHQAIKTENPQELEPWMFLWYKYTAGTFLNSYLETADGAVFIPSGQKQLENMLDIYMLEKAVYELGYELNNRPDWILIPMNGITSILKKEL